MDKIFKIVLDIDDQSLSEIGQWPWPRSVLADLVNKTYLSASLGFDIVFAEFDRTGSNELKKQYKNNSSLFIKSIWKKFEAGWDLSKIISFSLRQYNVPKFFKCRIRAACLFTSL